MFVRIHLDIHSYFRIQENSSELEELDFTNLNGMRLNQQNSTIVFALDHTDDPTGLHCFQFSSKLWRFNFCILYTYNLKFH